MKKEGIQTRNRKSSSTHKSGAASKSAGCGDDDATPVPWSLPQQSGASLPSTSRSLPHQFKTFASSTSSDVHRPSLSANYCFEPMTSLNGGIQYASDDTAAALYPGAYAHAQQVPADYAGSCIAPFGGATNAASFSVAAAAAAGYCL